MELFACHLDLDHHVGRFASGHLMSLVDLDLEVGRRAAYCSVMISLVCSHNRLASTYKPIAYTFPERISCLVVL